MRASWQQNQPRSFISHKRDIYIPHPAPDAAGNEEEEKAARMGATWSLLKTLIIPAIISLILYLFISYLIVPVWKRYRGRYSNYLPLDTISNHTTSFRHRVQGTVANILVPSIWRRELSEHVSAQGGNVSDFDEDEGEELSGFDDNRRLALSLDAARGIDEEGRRLSRDLEEGFKDDSDDDSDAAIDTRSRSVSR